MKKASRNVAGQPPTREPRETVERLEQKKQKIKGAANQRRIEDQEREVRSER